MGVRTGTEPVTLNRQGSLVFYQEGKKKKKKKKIVTKRSSPAEWRARDGDFLLGKVGIDLIFLGGVGTERIR